MFAVIQELQGRPDPSTDITNLMQNLTRLSTILANAFAQVERANGVQTSGAKVIADVIGDLQRYEAMSPLEQAHLLDTFRRRLGQ